MEEINHMESDAAEVVNQLRTLNKHAKVMRYAIIVIAFIVFGIFMNTSSRAQYKYVDCPTCTASNPAGI